MLELEDSYLQGSCLEAQPRLLQSMSRCLNEHGEPVTWRLVILSQALSKLKSICSISKFSVPPCHPLPAFSFHAPVFIYIWSFEPKETEDFPPLDFHFSAAAYNFPLTDIFNMACSLSTHLLFLLPENSCVCRGTRCLLPGKPVSFTTCMKGKSKQQLTLCRGEIPKQTCNRLT